MSKKKQKTSWLQAINDKRLAVLGSVLVAIIGCSGTIFVAVSNYMSASMQIEKPISFTQTIEAKTPIPQVTTKPPATAIISPTSVPKQPLLSASTTYGPCGVTVIPDYIKPSNGVEQALKQIIEAENRGEIFPLAVSYGNRLSLSIEFRSKVQTNDWLKLDNKMKVTITSDSNVKSKVNIREVSGCGGGMFRYFSPDVGLNTDYPTYSLDVEYDDFDFFTLQPGEFEYFDLAFYCQTPGIYTVSIELPYSLSNASDYYTYTVPVQLVCPENFSLWNSYPINTLQYGGDFKWDGKEYNRSE